MNRKFTIAAIAATLMLASACNARDLNFKTIEREKTVVLTDGSASTLRMSVEVEFLSDATVGKDIEKVINDEIVKALFGNEFVGLPHQDVVNEWMRKSEEEYRTTNLGTYEKFMKDNPGARPMGFSWETKLEGEEGDTYRNIVTYKAETYMYTGGAHGSTSEMYYNFDINTGKLLNSEDVFAAGTEEEIGKLLMKHLNDDNDDADDEKIVLSVDRIEPNGNFEIEEDGITFTFNQYEIAAYSYGAIDIFIPKREIKQYLAPGFKIY